MRGDGNKDVATLESHSARGDATTGSSGLSAPHRLARICASFRLQGCTLYVCAQAVHHAARTETEGGEDDKDGWRVTCRIWKC